MNKIKLCIFDMDGLLIDTERCAWSIGKITIGKEYGVNITPELSADLTGFDRRSFVAETKKLYGQDFPGDEFMDKLARHYENFCRNEEIPLRPGAIELLNFVKQNNILLSLGTSTDKELAEIALKKTGLENYFDYKVFGNQVKHGKPNPEIYLKSVEHFGLRPEDCVVFEDTPTGAKAAYDGNINLIMVPDLKKPTDLDRKKALAIIYSLQDAISIIKKINNI